MFVIAELRVPGPGDTLHVTIKLIAEECCPDGRHVLILLLTKAAFSLKFCHHSGP